MQELKIDDESENENLNESSEAVVNVVRHTAHIRLDMGSDQVSNMICRVLSVDKEPSRSKATRCLSTDHQFLLADFISSDRKYLQKSMDNFMDMCDLARQTFEIVSKYEVNSLQEPLEKRAKEKKITGS